MSAGAAIAILGLGEAGTAIARDLVAAGARVRGWDPMREPPDGVERAAGERDAARGAELVLSVNSAATSVAVAEAVAPVLGDGRLFADLNTAAPSVKRAAAAAVGAGFADVALIGPVPGRGIRTPALVSGPAAESCAEALGRFGMPISVVGPEPGAASARKLARSVFAKGLAASVGEALDAAGRLGVEPWLYADIEATLTAADGELLRRLVDGSSRHAGRRAEEMDAAAILLEELGVEPRVARASEAWLRSLAGSEARR